MSPRADRPSSSSGPEPEVGSRRPAAVPDHPVRPRLTLFIVLILAIAGCGSDPQPSPSPPPGGSLQALEGTAWKLVSIQGRQPPAGADVTAAFGPERIAGNGPCNGYFGTYAYDRSTGALRIGDLGSTKRACAEPARNDLEAAFFQSLSGDVAASVDPTGRLVLSGSGAALVLALAPQPGVPADGLPSDPTR